MAISAKYFITDPHGNYIDWSTQVSGFSLLGKGIQLTGGAGDDTLYVQAGTSADATNLDIGNDKIYLTGNLADYTQSINQETYVFTLSRSAGGQTEQVSFTVADQDDVVYFANGHIVINGVTNTDLFSGGALHQIQGGWLTAGGTPASPVTTAATTATNPTKVFIVDPNGLDVPMLMQPGQSMTITGSGGVDTVYVNAGTSVDATNLDTGNDRIYLLGNLGSYTQSINAETYVFTLSRNVSGKTEQVSFTVADQDDVVYFADGHIVINGVTNTNLFSGGTLHQIQGDWLTAGGTPLPGPTVTITSTDNALKVGETATINFALSEAAANSTAFDVSDIQYAGGTLSALVADDPTHYHATFTPTAGSETAAAISVAAGAFKNADAQDSGAASLNLAVDTLAPTTTLTSASYSDATDVLTVTGTNLGTLGVANGTDVKSQLAWGNLVWDINGDGATTGDKTFSVNDITSAIVTSGTTLAITLTSSAAAALETMVGFGNAAGGADTLDVTAGFVSDAAGNAAASDGLNNGTLNAPDTTPPAATVTNAGYNETTNVLTVTGTNFNTLGVADGTDVKSQLAWGKLVWDVNGDGATTGDKTFSASDITSAIVTNATTLTVTLTSDAATALEAMTGFGDVTGGADKLDVTAGFISDTAGNAATTDGASNATLVTDNTPPTATITSAAYNVATGVIAVTGANFDTLGVSTGADVKAQLNWSHFVWDINGDDGTTANKTFAVSDITSAVVTNATTLTITLTGGAKTALEATTGFAAAGGADKLDVTAGFIKDTAGNAATTDARANGAISYSDVTAPTVTSFSSTTAAGAYNAGDQINITATVSEAVLQNATFDVTLDTNDVVTLTATSAGTTLTGSYTVAAPDTSADLTVSSYTVGSVSDLYGNAMATTTLPANQNLADNEAIVIDTTAPSATVSSASYNNGTGTITVTGTNFGTLGVANGTDVKNQLDWTKLSWDTNGDNATTANKTFSASEITSAIVTNATTLTITLTAGGKSALESTAGYGYAGGLDKLDVTAGFIKDAAGNAATTDALANGAILYSDVTAPSAATLAPTAAEGPTLNHAEEADGFDVVVSLGGTSALAGDVLELKLGGNSFATPLTHVLTSGDIGSGSYTFTVAAGALGPDGSKSLTGVVTDAAGNIGSASPALALTLDTTAPGAGAAPSTAAGSVIDAGEAAAGITVVASLSGTSAAAGDTLELKLDGASFATPKTHVLQASDISAGIYNFSVAGADLGSDGAKLLTSVVTDIAGNLGTASAALDVTLNTTAGRSLAYSAGTFIEGEANNGTINNSVTITLTGDTFAGSDGASLNSSVTFGHVPSGLTAQLLKVSATTATLTLSGTAGAHADVNDVSDLTLTFGNAAFTGGNASGVTGYSRSDMRIDFADSGHIFAGDSGDNNLLNVATNGNDIIYGKGGADVINGLGGNDTIDIVDAGTTAAASATVVVTSVSNGVDTVFGFKGGAIASGGDVLDFTGIGNLVDSVATGLTTGSDFGANNVFIFNGTQTTSTAAAAAIAADATVTATEGYFVIADSNNGGRVTVFHSDNLAGDGAETALVILSGVNISSLTAANFVV